MAQTQSTTYIALFHHRDHAASALRDLQKSGFGPDAITVIGGGNGKSYSEAGNSFGEDYSYGAQHDLASVGVPEADRKHLQQGLDQGGTVLALQAAGDRADDIEKIFHQHATKKIDETDVNRDEDVAPVAAVPAATAESTLIPVVEESLVVGKREVDRGGVRVYRRTVEEPVTANVLLHEEHVVIQRTPVDRAITDADMLGGDRVIELTETAEEAVIGKTARVVEEIHVGKQATDHTETIRDTVRHTEVDVEQVVAADNTTSNKY